MSDDSRPMLDVRGLQVKYGHIEAVKGMSIVTPGYWDTNDETRAFADKFKKRFRDRIPT